MVCRVLKKSERVRQSLPTGGVCMVQGLDDPGPVELALSTARYTTSTGGVRGSACLPEPLAGAFARGVQRNVDEYRGAVANS